MSRHEFARTRSAFTQLRRVLNALLIAATCGAAALAGLLV